MQNAVNDRITQPTVFVLFHLFQALIFTYLFILPLSTDSQGPVGPRPLSRILHPSPYQQTAWERFLPGRKWRWLVSNTAGCMPVHTRWDKRTDCRQLVGSDRTARSENGRAWLCEPRVHPYLHLANGCRSTVGAVDPLLVQVSLSHDGILCIQAPRKTEDLEPKINKLKIKVDRKESKSS